MTRETLPRFDLYGELEVSPSASVGTIESAYRSLVKQHHPDVTPTGATAGDDARIKRLNLAREWLTDPDRRRRYDASRSRPSPTTYTAWGGRSRRSNGAPGSPAGPDGGGLGGRGDRPSEPTFGPNAGHVRQFLAELRGLDRDRARQVWDGRAVAHAQGYSKARRAAVTVGRGQRREEWLFAREAASVIARGELGDSILTDQVLDVVADAAGALVVRDLLPRRDLELLLMPWTWRGEPVSHPAPAPATKPPTPPPAQATPIPPPAPTTPTLPRASAVPTRPQAAAMPSPSPVVAVAAPPGAITASPPAPPQPPRVSIADLGASPWRVTPELERALRESDAAHRPRAAVFGMERPSRMQAWLPFAAGFIGVLLVGGLIATFIRPAPSQGVASATDAPTFPGGTVVIGGNPATDVPASDALPATSDQPGSTSTAEPGATGVPGDPATAGPNPTQPNTGTPAPSTGPNPTTQPNPTPTPSPSQPPGPTPTPAPTPPPTPTPAPTPTPEPTCTVPNLIGLRVPIAQTRWTDAGFTGPLSLASPIPAGHVIASQSVPAGTDLVCTSGITVDD